MSATKRRKRKAKFQALETIRHRESSKTLSKSTGRWSENAANRSYAEEDDAREDEDVQKMLQKMMLKKMKM